MDNLALIDTGILKAGEEVDSACWRGVVNVKNLIQRGRAKRGGGGERMHRGC